MREILSLRQVAERLGWNRTETLYKLMALHEQHGGILFRRRGRRTKYRVDLGALRTHWPSRFADAPAAEDLELAHERIDRVQELAERALRELGTLRRELRQRSHP